MRRRCAGRRFLVTALVAVAAALALPAAVAAHAELELSDPADGSSLGTSPRRIALTFSEEPDVAVSLVKVLDATGAEVPGLSAPRPVPGDELSLQVTPATPLKDGTYTVNWRVVSAVDGHVDSGAFAFGVGQEAGEVVVVELLHTSTLASALTGTGRWLLYAALAVLIGAVATSLLVYGGLPRGGVLVVRVAVAAGVVALALLTWGEKILVGAPTLLPLFQTRQGGFLLALGIALGVCVVGVVVVDLWPSRWSLAVLGAAAMTAVVVHVAGGHAASASPVWPLNVTVQVVHMTAIGVWVGGLFWVLLGFRGRDRHERSAAVAVFTRIATVTLVVVLVTGLARAAAQVGSATALVDSSYGLTLLIKLGLVTTLVGLGALNHFFWVPAVRRGGGAAAERRFGLNSRGELVVALGVLAVTAVLSGAAPADTAAAGSGGASAPANAATAAGADYATSMRVELTLAPGVAGRNSYTLWADDYDTGDPLTSVTAVRLRCSLPAQPSLSPETIELDRVPDGSWTGAGLDFSVAGRWKVDVYVQEEARGTTVQLELDVRPAPGAQSTPSP